MTVTLVARDVAPSKAFERVKSELEKRGNQVRAFLGGGKPLPDETRTKISSAIVHPGGSNRILLGMSSSEELAREEIYAANIAVSENIPFGFYSDTYGCHNRPWFSYFRAKAGYVFVINDKEAIAARKVFPKAKIIASGNPLWEDFCFPKFTRQEVREKLGVSENEAVILCPGTKSLAVNLPCFVAALDAANLMKNFTYWKPNQKIKVVITIHPGDQNNPKIYQELVQYSSVPAQVVSNEVISTSEMLSGVDVVVESMSSTGIEAAHLRIPVISYLTSVALKRMAVTSWEPCDLGVAEEVRGSAKELAEKLYRLLMDHEGARAALCKKQAEVFPAPAAQGTAVRRIIDALAELNPVE